MAGALKDGMKMGSFGMEPSICHFVVNCCGLEPKNQFVGKDHMDQLSLLLLDKNHKLMC